MTYRKKQDKYFKSGIQEKITESEYQEEINILNDNLSKLYAIFVKHNVLDRLTVYEDTEKEIDKFLSNIKAKDLIYLESQLKCCQDRDLEKEYIIKENEKTIGHLKSRLRKSEDFFKKMYK